MRQFPLSQGRHSFTFILTSKWQSGQCSAAAPPQLCLASFSVLKLMVVYWGPSYDLFFLHVKQRSFALGWNSASHNWILLLMGW